MVVENLGIGDHNALALSAVVEVEVSNSIQMVHDFRDAYFQASLIQLILGEVC